MIYLGAGIIQVCVYDTDQDYIIGHISTELPITVGALSVFTDEEQATVLLRHRPFFADKKDGDEVGLNAELVAYCDGADLAPGEEEC